MEAFISLFVTLFLISMCSLRQTYGSDFGPVLKLETENSGIFYTNTTSVGDYFTVSMIAENISEDQELYGWEFVLTWNPDVVNCTTETVNTNIWSPFLGPWISQPINDTAGEYHQSVTGKPPSPPFYGTTWLVNLTFQILQAPMEGGSIIAEFTIMKASGYTAYCLLDQNGDEIPHRFVVNGFQFISVIHDIAVLSVVTSKSRCVPVETVGQGYTAEMNITVKNQGNFTETFNVTVYANTTVTNTVANITLTSGDSTIITLTWNTTNLDLGNYTIGANITQVQDETDLIDNTLTYGSILVTIPGDINGDKSINNTDASLLGNVFGSLFGDSAWNGNADINNDECCNAKDAVILGTHWE